ncbi:ribosome biogenesis protein WDR12 homolog [Watersipora subatra]|uniref:ribosome biogenesis protein WDR12 homolog n=1 Tax=Watersipora subatra TaxID=2589382 RepID=UPI00355ADDB8
MNEQTIGEPQHAQIMLLTKLERFSPAAATFSLPAESGCVELSELLHASLQNQELLKDGEMLEFDFLIEGELLRSSIIQYMENKQISTETVVNIEFILKLPSPTPEQSLLHNDWVSCVQANGQYVLSGCYDNTVKIHTLDGKELLTLPAHSAPVRCLSWLSTGDDVQTFVTGSHDQLLHVWRWETSSNSIRCLYKCAGHAFSVEDVTASPDRLQFASVSRDMTLKIWSTDERGVSLNTEEAPAKKRKTHEVQTKVPIVTLAGHHEGVVGVCWREPSDLVTVGLDHTIRLWNLEMQSNTQTITSSKALLAIDCSPISGKFVTGSSDRHVRLWDSKVSDASMVIGNFSSHTGWVSSVKWSERDENLFVSGSYDNLTKLWDIRSPKTPLFDLTGHNDKVLAVDWSRPSHIISGGADNSLNIFAYKS